MFHRYSRRIANFTLPALLGLHSFCTSPEQPHDTPAACAINIAPSGGRMELAATGCADSLLSGLSLEIPAGAVQAPVQLTVQRQASLAGPGETEAGPAIRILPENLVLQQPITISLPYYRERVSFADKLVAALGTKRVPLDNPLQRFIASAPARPPFTVSTHTLGAMQSLVVMPPGSTGLANVREIDILFVIDNSNSMEDKQAMLVQQFPLLIDKIAPCTNASIHIGVITPNAGTVTSDVAPGCATPMPATDGGILENTPCRLRTGLGSDPRCLAACPRMTRPAGGVRYIEFETDAKGEITKTNLDGMDPPTPAARLDKVKEAFGCMAYVGANGCGIEQPFEAVKRAIDRSKAENNKFFRSLDPASSALLAIVFLTDEDDCSLNRREWSSSDPAILDASSPDRYKRYNSNMRCLAMSAQCNGSDTALETPGKKTDCVPKNYPSDADPYLKKIDDLTKAIAIDPMGNKRTVVIGGIWPRPFYTKRKAMAGDPYARLYTDVQLESIGGHTPATSEWLTPKLSACSGLLRGAGSAPQHRLSAFADHGSVTASYQGDICDPGEYAIVMEIVGYALQSQCPYMMRP